MERKTLRQFHHELHWSTRIYTLATLVTIFSAFLFDAWTTTWTMTILSVIAVILFVESLSISINRHPHTWRNIGWVVLLLLLALMLISFVF